MLPGVDTARVGVGVEVGVPPETSLDVSKKDAAPALIVNAGAASTSEVKRGRMGAPEAAPRAGAGATAGAGAPAGAEAGAGRGAKTGPARERAKPADHVRKVIRGGGN